MGTLHNLHCYKHFKKHFYNAVFLEKFDLRSYALKEALLSHQENNFYLEFGVYQGNSINSFSKILKDIKIYGFDSFEGLEEDWVTREYNPAGTFTLNKKSPKVLKNVRIVKGKVQNTLENFLKDFQILKISLKKMSLILCFYTDLLGAYLFLFKMFLSISYLYYPNRYNRQVGMQLHISIL